MTKLLKYRVVSAFHAELSPTIEIDSTRGRFNFFITGSAVLELEGRDTLYLTQEGLGFDLVENGKVVVSSSQGAWIDTDGDRIFRARKPDQHLFSMIGGTGKWHGIAGSDDAFEVHETPATPLCRARLFVGISQGTLTWPE